MMIAGVAYIYVTFIKKEKYQDRAKKYKLYFAFLTIVLLIIQQLFKTYFLY